jgi:hypothetical protein
VVNRLSGMARLPQTRAQGNGRPRVPTSDSTILEEVRIGFRLKLAALWTAALLLFAYGDIFGFFTPGRIEEVATGEVSGIKIT